MAEPTTLKELAAQEHSSIVARNADAQAELTAARDTLLGVPGDPLRLGAMKHHQQVSTELAQLQQAFDAIRRALAVAAMPADVDALAEQLRQLFSKRRNQRRALVTAERDLHIAQQKLELAKDKVQRLSNQLAQAEAKLGRETDREKAIDDWRSALQKEPLASVRALAADVLASGGPGEEDGDASQVPPELKDAKAQFLAARDRVAADIPAALLLRAQQRPAQVGAESRIEATLLAKAEELLAAKQRDQHGQGLVDGVTRTQSEFERSESGLGSYVRTVLERFKTSTAMLLRAAQRAGMTDAERRHIDDLTAAGQPAVATQKTRDEARQALAQARANLEMKRLEVLAQDLNADFDSAEGVSGLKTALSQAESNLRTAQTSFDALREALEAWEAAIPDSTWENLDDFERAKEILQEISDTDVEQLVSKLRENESLVIQRSLSLAQSTRGLDFLRVEVERYKSTQAFAEATKRTRLINGIRGED